MPARLCNYWDFPDGVHLILGHWYVHGDRDHCDHCHCDHDHLHSDHGHRFVGSYQLVSHSWEYHLSLPDSRLASIRLLAPPSLWSWSAHMQAEARSPGDWHDCIRGLWIIIISFNATGNIKNVGLRVDKYYRISMIHSQNKIKRNFGWQNGTPAVFLETLISQGSQ